MTQAIELDTQATADARRREREFVAYGLPLNLHVLGFIKERSPANYFALLMPVAVVLQYIPSRPFRWLAITAFLLYFLELIRSLNPRWRWTNGDGNNRHHFAVRAEPIRWNGIFRKTPQDANPWLDYLQQPIRDPNLGVLECDFRFEDSTASTEYETVFRIQRKPEKVPKGVPADSLAKWHGTYRVLADPRLHPDTVESLVERFALKKSEWAKRQFLVNRTLGGG